MKVVGNIIFIIASILIIFIAAHAGVTRHEECNECTRVYEATQPSQLYVESGSFGLGYMLANW